MQSSSIDDWYWLMISEYLWNFLVESILNMVPSYANMLFSPLICSYQQDTPVWLFTWIVSILISWADASLASCEAAPLFLPLWVHAGATFLLFLLSALSLSIVRTIERWRSTWWYIRWATLLLSHSFFSKSTFKSTSILLYWPS